MIKIKKNKVFFVIIFCTWMLLNCTNIYAKYVMQNEFNSSMENETDSSGAFETIMINALQVPGVKVNRNKFLYDVLSKFERNSKKISDAISTNPIEAGIDRKTLDKASKYTINKTTTISSGASFAAGLPGGVAMAASIPADILQYFGMTIRLAQELAYIYGEEDLFDGSEIDDSRVRQTLIVYIGVMFGVQGASEAVRLISVQLSKTALKKLPQKALTKTFYYPIIKKICAILSIKVTKKSFAQFVSKAIPIVGGVISGGMTFFSLRPMGQKLQECLSEAKFDYNENSIKEDIETIEKLSENEDIIDVEYMETFDEEIIEDQSENMSSEYNKEKALDKNIDIVDELETCKKLLEQGLISEDEAKKIKDELLKKYYNI